MAPRKKSHFQDTVPAWVLLLILAVAVVTSIFIIESNVLQGPTSTRFYSPEEFSKKLIEVKKDPLPQGWIKSKLMAFQDEPAKQKAAIDVVYNQMLSKVEASAHIPSTFPPDEVEQDFKKYLSQIYGDPNEVPNTVYRVACLRIINNQIDFQRFYSGSPKELEAIVYRVIAEYYDLGTPPVTMTISSAEDYFRKHRIKRQNKAH